MSSRRAGRTLKEVCLALDATCRSHQSKRAETHFLCAATIMYGALTSIRRIAPPGVCASAQRRLCGTFDAMCQPSPPCPSHTPAWLLYTVSKLDFSLTRRSEQRYWSKASADRHTPSPSASRTTMVAQLGTTSWCLPTARSAWTRAWRSFERASLRRSRRAGAYW